MQRLEVSGAVRHIYIYVRWKRVNTDKFSGYEAIVRLKSSLKGLYTTYVIE
jgi:hypothetical protein